MANQRREVVPYRKFQAEPLLSDGLLAVTRPGGELQGQAASGFFRLAERFGAMADQQAATDNVAAARRNVMANRPRVGVEAGTAAPAGADAGGDHRSMAAAILRKEEGFRETPYWDVNAYRTGYGSDTITLADGSVKKVEKGMRVSRDDAERDLTRRLGEFERTAAGQVGADRWNRLPAQTRAALLSVTYNYGSLPGSVRRAVAGGDNEAIATAVGNLSANRSRRQREAAAIRGGGAAPGGPAAPPAITASGGGWRPSGRNTIAGRAYDEEGAKLYLRMLDTERRSTTSQVYERYKDDPAMLEKALGDLKGVFMREHVYPEIAPEFDLSFDEGARPFVEQSRKNLADRITADRRAAHEERGAALETDLARKRESLDLNSPEADRALADGLAALDDHYDAAIDQDLMTPQVAGDAKAAARRTTVVDWYARQAELYNPDEVNALLEGMRADFSAGRLDGIDSKGWAALEARLVAIEKDKRSQARAGVTEGRRAGKALADRAAQGFDVPDTALTDLATAVGGTEAGAAIIEQTRRQIEAAKAIRALPLEDAEAYVRRMKDGLGGDPTDDAIATLTYAEGLLEKTRKAIQTDPLGHAADNRLIDLVPIDPSSPDALAASLGARRAQAEAVAARFGVPVKLYRPDEVKAMKADLASTDPKRHADLMTQLDFLSAGGRIDEIAGTFGDKAADQLQDWQARLRYATAEETAAWLKDKADPKWQDRVKPLVAEGERKARAVSFEDVVTALDGDNSWFWDRDFETAGPAGSPIDPDTKRMLMNDFVQLTGQRYVTTGDLAAAQEQAIQRMQKVWGVSRVYGDGRGRLMPYPPEESYPAVGGSKAWIGEELAGLAKERGVELANLSLVADGKTKAAADRGEAPGYLLSVVDPETGLDQLVTDEQGRVIRHFFDPAAAQAKALRAAEEDRRTQHDPWVVLGEGTAIGPFYPPWRPATDEDMAMREKRIREMMGDKRDDRAARRERHIRNRVILREQGIPNAERP